jgi:hypothetical protein
VPFAIADLQSPIIPLPSLSEICGSTRRQFSYFSKRRWMRSAWGEGERVGFVASRKGLMGPGSNIYRFASPTRQSEYGGSMSTANQLVWW